MIYLVAGAHLNVPAVLDAQHIHDDVGTLLNIFDYSCTHVRCFLIDSGAVECFVQDDSVCIPGPPASTRVCLGKYGAELSVQKRKVDSRALYGHARGHAGEVNRSLGEG